MLPSAPNWYFSRICSWNTNHIFAYASKNLVQLYDTKLDTLVGHLQGHTNRVTCVQFFPFDDQKCVSGSIDCSVRVWDTTTKECISMHTEHKVSVASDQVDLDIECCNMCKCIAIGE